MLAVGQDGMLRDLVEEAMKGLPPRLDEVVIEALHHAFHNKLLRERLDKQSGGCSSTINQLHMFDTAGVTT